MPKKKKKTKQQEIAEEYFPISKPKKTTEKKEKTIIKEYNIIEKKEKPKNTKKITIEKKYKKPKRKTTEKKEEYKPPKIKLKKGGYELIITEKPQAALKIASALGKSTQKTINKVPYYEVKRNGKNIVVACAVGHLFTLKQNTAHAKIPTFDISWIPNYLARKKDFTKRYYDTILKLSKSAGSITVATDFDVEGEVIGLNVVRYLCSQKDASRMKFSTLTPKELDQAYENKTPHIEWGQAIAGETRHYLDWFYGINLSRALMNAIKTTGKFKLMSIGRVQGPALNLIVKKENEIKKFKSKPYWQIFIEITDKKHKVELKHNKDIYLKKNLGKFKNLKGKKATAETKHTEQTLPPNPPFNLTTLQTESYKLFHFKPARTLQIAQSLYLAGLISYPRTSSQKLPDSINYKSIIKKLAKKFKAEELIKRKKPVEGKKTDAAHPSIYPTGEEKILSGDEEKIYKLIVKRFLSLFCESAIIDKKRIIVKIKDILFSAHGLQIRKKAWTKIYPYKPNENKLPNIDGEVKITKLKIEEKETQPPKRYSPASIISELEKRNLGTKATRSSIVETLFDRGYVDGTSIKATPFGIALIHSLKKYSPIIIEEKLTRKFEDKMKSIEKLKKGHIEKEQKIINKAKKTIRKISKNFEEHEKKIGKNLLHGKTDYIEQLKKENELTLCPVCKKGHLAITYSRKTKRHFVACNAYPNCKTTFSLPPDGVIKKIDKLCEKCKFPLLMRLKHGRRPWIFCFNPKCETNKERLEEYRKKHPK